MIPITGPRYDIKPEDQVYFARKDIAICRAASCEPGVAASRRSILNALLIYAATAKRIRHADSRSACC